MSLPRPRSRSKRRENANGLGRRSSARVVSWDAAMNARTPPAPVNRRGGLRGVGVLCWGTFWDGCSYLWNIGEWGDGSHRTLSISERSQLR